MRLIEIDRSYYNTERKTSRRDRDEQPPLGLGGFGDFLASFSATAVESEKRKEGSRTSVRGGLIDDQVVAYDKCHIPLNTAAITILCP